MKILIIFIFHIFFLSGCSTPQFMESSIRTPAQTLAISFDEIVSIESSNVISADNHTPMIQSILKSLGKFELIENDLLEEGIAYKLDLDISKNKIITKIYHSKNALFDFEATIHILTFLMNSYGQGSNVFNELFANAKAGDLKAMENLIKFKSQKAKYLFYSYKNKKDNQAYLAIEEQLQKRFEKTANILEPIKVELKKRESLQQVQEINRKALLDILDKAPPEDQLKSLVAKNDRKGVANLLRNYLPFESMAPVEKKFWETYLDTIQNPVVLEDRIYTYRGINDDIIYSAQIAGNELSKSDAIKKNKAFLMSTLITKNQGSWNRRLRSLQTMNTKFIGTIEGEQDLAMSSRIATMMRNHSQNPQGSPFLSFTPDFKIATYADGKYATDFGSKRVSAFLIDPRLLKYNYSTIHDEEIEFLTNLITFPDELVGIWDLSLHENFEPEKFLNDRLNSLMSETYGSENAIEKMRKVYQNSKSFYAPVFKFIPVIDVPANKASPFNCHQAVKQILGFK